MIFEKFPDNSRVWIYAADRFLKAEEEVFVKRNLDAFVDQWAAHGSELAAAGVILEHTFIVLIADESNVSASGCSIDTSVRFIKDLGKELNIDFLNRLSIVIEKDGELKHIHFNDLSSYPDWNMYDASVKNLKEFRENWKQLIKESSFIR